MLFAVSGSQGSGKSSVLSGLEDQGFKVMRRKISRSILTDWDVTLDEVNSNIPLTLKFQDEIIKRKCEDEQEAIASNDIYFTERTYLDSFVYYMFSFGKMSEFDDKITAYYNTCVEYNKNYSSVFFLPSGMFKTVADGVRGTNPYYVESVNTVLTHYQNKTLADRIVTVNLLSIEDRVKFVSDCVMDFA